MKILFKKWALIIIILIGVTAFASYRITLNSMNAGSAVSVKSSVYPGLEKGQKVMDETITEEKLDSFKKIVNYETAPTPDHNKIKKIQQDLFNATPQIKAIRNSIGILHQELDYKLGVEAVVAMEQDDKDVNWRGFTGTPDQLGNSVQEMLSRIDNIISKLTDKKLISDLQKARRLLQEGTEKRDVVLLWEAHNIIHDLDYFMINYPVIVKTGVAATQEGINGPGQYWRATTILP